MAQKVLLLQGVLFLNKPVALIILPRFAMPNRMVIPQNWYSGLASHREPGHSVGLGAWEALGVLLFSMLSVSLGMAVLPRGVVAAYCRNGSWWHWFYYVYFCYSAGLSGCGGDPCQVSDSTFSVLSGSVRWLVAFPYAARLPGERPGEESGVIRSCPCSHECTQAHTTQKKPEKRGFFVSERISDGCLCDY
jgi:hypothetical protein